MLVLTNEEEFLAPTFTFEAKPTRLQDCRFTKDAGKNLRLVRSTPEPFLVFPNDTSCFGQTFFRFRYHNSPFSVGKHYSPGFYKIMGWVMWFWEIMLSDHCGVYALWLMT